MRSSPKGQGQGVPKKVGLWGKIGKGRIVGSSEKGRTWKDGERRGSQKGKIRKVEYIKQEGKIRENWASHKWER